MPGQGQGKQTNLHKNTMKEEYLRSDIREYLDEQNLVSFIESLDFSTKLLCLIAGINGYSFSDYIINGLSQFIPSEEEIEKYR
jgi:hypothetical protein